MHYIVSYSGGAASWAAAKIVVDDIATADDKVTLLFADTLIEDQDTYRFLEQGAEVLGLTVTKIADGRTPFEVFRDERFLGNTMADPCSKILKRRLLDRWAADAAREGPVTCVVGLDWTEIDRFERHRAKVPVHCIAPLIDRKITKAQVHRMVRDAGLPRQRLYEMGMQHANCGGGCVKQGQTGFAQLYRAMPGRFAYWEEQEQEIREYLGRDVSILRDRRGNQTRRLTLRELRERIESQPELIPSHDWGGCGCAID